MYNFQITKKESMGFLLIIGVSQFIFSILIAEGLAENYDSQLHYVSTLGTSTVSFVFNISVIILGLCLLLSSYLLHKNYQKRLSTSLMILTGICALGVGIFPENSRPFHGIFTGFVFIFAALLLISLFQLEKSNFLNILSVFGVFLLLLLLFLMPYLGLDIEDPTTFLGFFKGTLERSVIYLSSFGFIAFGGYLTSKNTETFQKL